MNKQLNILVVEDQKSSYQLIDRALSEINVNVKLIWLQSGDEVLPLLEQQGKTIHAIFLNLKLPKLEGSEVLKLLEQRPDIPRLPIYILSGLP
ncbi:MAG: response regulator, partial [Zetaproteobacteria bacterium]|nr:response regulator [Zetaproteobacteria bacterium]